MSTNVSRRTFVKGAGLAGTAAALTALAGTAQAKEASATADSAAADTAEAEADDVTGDADAAQAYGTNFGTNDAEQDGPGTRYTKYPNTDEIGIVHDASSEEDVDLVVCGTGIGGMLCAMLTAEQMPEAKIVIAEARSFCGGGTNYAEQNDLPLPGLTWEDAVKQGDQIATDSHFIKDGRLYAEKLYDQGKNSAWLYLKHQLVLTSDRHPLYEGGNGAATIQRLVDMVGSDPAYANIDLRLNTRATALLLDDAYTCTGIQVKDQESGSYTNLNAKAVVLFTGGMSNNLGLLKYYTNQDVCKLECEDQGHFGDGMVMAEQTAHGRCKTIALSSMMGFVPDTSKTSNLSAAVSVNPTCCFVNQDGVRFTREDVEYSLPTEMGASAPNYQVNYSKMVEGQGRVYSIVGSNLMQYIVDGNVEHKGGFYGGTDDWKPAEELEQYMEAGNPNIFKADTLEELAQMIDVPADAFVQTIEQYDADAEAGTGDTVYEKPAEHMVALGDAPYYAFALKSFLVNTNNGIRVNSKCQVVDPYYVPVKGLYAGGIAISGFNDDIYSTGLCQSVSIWSGSKAARTLIEENLGGTVADDWYGDKEYEDGDPLNQEDFKKWNF